MLTYKNSTVSLLALLFFTHHCLLPSNIEKQPADKPIHECWLNVFIHGTEAPMLAFVSFFKVMNEKTNGTLYQVLQKKIRNNSSAHKYQLMSGYGLEHVNILSNTHTDNLAIKPTIKAYERLTQKLLQSEENKLVHHEYYMFGWDGILGHRARKEAANNLYKALNNELASYHNLGITPKIRLICHSHGGNVALNLAALPQLSDKTSITFEIDELLLYGTPIQAETEQFCFFPMFKKVINFYSDSDMIQSADWISTKKRKCSKKIKITEEHQNNPLNQIIQVKFMINHHASTKKSHTKKRAKDMLSLLGRGGKPFGPHRYDPAHQDFWFLNKKKSTCTFFDPLPLATYTPLFLAAINQASSSNLALHCIINQDSQSIMFNIHECSQQTTDPLHVYQFPLATLENIKQEIFT